MGVLTDFFIANDQELSEVCRGWKRPAPVMGHFRTFEAINPFTGQPLTGRTRSNPDQPMPDPDAVTDCDFSSLPSINQKGILTGEIANLASVLMDWDYENASEEVHGRALVGPRCEQTVCEMHPEILARLAALSPEEITRYGTDWSNRQREEAKTIENDYWRQQELGRPDSEWISRLTEIASLAKQAVASSRSMFMWMCP
jgi:hypothetical protein